MKTGPFLLMLAAVLLAGCETTSVSDRFAAVPPQVLVIEADSDTVNRAAQRAFKRLDFTLVRNSVGRIEAASAINTSKTFGDSRQIVARVRISGTEEGRSEVELALTEEVGSASMGGTRQVALREHSFFQTYFAMLQQVMQEIAAEAADDKN